MTDNWSKEELTVSVKAYLWMLREEKVGRAYVKTHVLRDAQMKIPNRKLNHFRMQNISAVLDKLGQSWIKGYKPRRNLGPYERLIEELLDELGYWESDLSKDSSQILADEANISKKYLEGSVETIEVNKYERSGKARQECINYYGPTCAVCGFDFEKFYGSIGEDYIHVHHLKEISSIGEEYEVDPIEDLRPLCPNCHAMIHKKSNGQAFTIAELIKLVKNQKTHRNIFIESKV